MEYRNTTQFEDDVKSLSADSKTAIKEESFTNEAKLIARVQQLKLTRDISDWKQAKSYTIVDKNKLKIFYKSDYSKYQDIDLNTQNIPEVWMQLIFALYEANAKYGISLDFSSNATNYFKVKKRDAKEQISLCLGLPTTPKKYDVFTFQTDYDVVIDPQSIGTKQDPSLEQLQQLIKQNKDSNLNKYAAEFRNKADFGGGIPWGLSLALFLPIFQTFYTGEKEASQISGYVMKIEDGHEDNWLTKKLNVTQIDKIYDDAKREIETALKQEKTYKLEDFKDANKVKALKARYNDLLVKYNAANKTIQLVKRQSKFVLPTTNLQNAKDLTQTLTEASSAADINDAEKALDTADMDVPFWENASNVALNQQTIIDTAKANLKKGQDEWNKLKTEYQKEKGTAYGGADPKWPDISVLITTDKFDEDVAAFNKSLEDIHNNKIKTLQLEIEKLKEDADKLPLVDSTRFDIPNFTKKTELINYFTKNSNPFQGVNTNIDPAWIEDIAKDNKRLTGLLHAIWGQENNNSQAVVRGLNMAIL